MGKVIKILISIFSAIVLSLIIFPLLVYILFLLPPVQNFVVHKATDFISSKLDTKVEIDKIHFKLFSEVVLDGVYVEDYHKDTLLYAAHISVGIKNPGIFKGDLSLGNVELSDACFYLKQDSTGAMNLTQILKKLKSDKPKKKTSSFRMDASQLTVRNVDFIMRKCVVTQRDYGVNFTDLDVYDFGFKGKQISIIGDSISLVIDSLTLKDKSGFELDRLKADKFAISSGGMRFQNLYLHTPDSELACDYLNFLNSNGWDAYNDFLNNVHIEIQAKSKRFAFGTVAFFAPTLRTWQSVLNDVSLTAEGTIADFKGHIDNANTRDTHVATHFGIKGIPDAKRMRFVFDVTQLNTTPADVDFIINDITGKSLGANKAMINRLNAIELTGHFDGLLSDFIADARVNTGLGGVALNLRMAQTAPSSRKFIGDVNIHGFNIGALLGNKNLKHASLTAKVDGRIIGGDINANTDAVISQLQFNNYNYNSIRINGLVENKSYTGKIECDEPNLGFDFAGKLDFTDSIPSYGFNLRLDRADLVKLNLNKRDKISTVRFNMMADGSGITGDDINGVITIDGLQYINHIDSVRTGRIKLVGENSTENKKWSLESTFADMQFTSHLSYRYLFDYLGRVSETYFPMLADGKEPKPELIIPDSTPSGYSEIRLNVKEANNVAGIFIPGLDISSNTDMMLRFNPKNKRIGLDLKSEYIQRDDKFLLTNINVKSRNIEDSLAIDATVADIYIGKLPIKNLSIKGGAKNDNVDLLVNFVDSLNSADVMAKLETHIGRDGESGRPQVILSIPEAYYAEENGRWDISAAKILYDSTKVAVDKFKISRQGQELTVNGIASANKNDTLRVKMANFDLSLLSRLTSKLGYKISGSSTGAADLVSLYDKGLMSADISFEDMKINEVELPQAKFTSHWDFQQEQARFDIVTVRDMFPVISGIYSPADGKLNIRADIRDIDIALLDPVLEGVIRNTSGSADAKLTLQGSLKYPMLTGGVNVKNIKTIVDFTNVEYTIPTAEIKVENNSLYLQPTFVYDPFGNKADFDLTLKTTYFKNFSYDVNIKPNNMLVLNTTAYNSDYFYGNMRASGVASIKGDNMGINMDIAATTSDNSSFFMPLSGKSDVKEVDFVTFKSKDNKTIVDTTDILSQKKMMFERKNKDVAKIAPNMNINLNIDVKDNTNFQLVIDPTVGDIIKGRGAGVLTIHVNPRKNEFSMYGDYRITEGDYLFTLQNIVNKKFIIEPGSSIKWAGDPLDAQLDITALYKPKSVSFEPLAKMIGSSVKFNRKAEVVCEILLKDKLSKPAISFDVNVENVAPEIQSILGNLLSTQEMKDEQFFYLLVLNSFYVGSSIAEQGIGLKEGGYATGIEFLTNQFANWVSSDNLGVGVKWKPKGETNSDEVDLAVSYEILGRLQLEVEGNYDFGNNAQVQEQINKQGASNFTGDYAITYLVDPAGTLKTKVYNRTIDRFDWNQGLKESGVGVYFHQDFDTFGDIIRGIKNRFKRKDNNFPDIKSGKINPDTTKYKDAIPQADTIRLDNAKIIQDTTIMQGVVGVQDTMKTK